MSTETAPAYWIVVGSPDNFERSRGIGFRLQGFKSRHRKKAARMNPGDRLVFYLTGLKAFAGISTVISPAFESHEPIWFTCDDDPTREDYPHRVETRPDLIRDPDAFIPAEPLARQMAYVAKWPPKNWTLAFQGNLHEIGAEDFRLIEQAFIRSKEGSTTT